MPLISGFEATTIWKAFTLNSIASSLVIFVAMMIKSHFDTYVDQNNNQVIRSTNWKSVTATLLFTFLATFIAYTILYYIFGYGKGMLATV